MRHVGAPAHERLERGHAQHDGIANDAIHLVALEERLCERHRDARFWRGGTRLDDAGADPSGVTDSTRATASRPRPSNTAIASPARSRTRAQDAAPLLPADEQTERREVPARRTDARVDCTGSGYRLLA